MRLAKAFTVNLLNIYEKIFVLGASGFIGRRITEELSSQKIAAVIGYSSRECDLLDQNSICRNLSHAQENDVLIVASAITRLKDNSYHSMLRNIEMAENLCRFLKGSPVSQVIFFSTVDVYGILPDDATIHEGLLPAPDDYYALSKITSEYILRQSLSRQDIPVTIFRLTGIYGPGDNGKSTINALVRAGRERGVISIFGDGDDQRDFVYVDDLCRLISLAIRQKTDVTVNVATGRSLAIVEIAKRIMENLSSECTLEFKPQDPSAEKRIKHMRYDIGLLETYFPDMAFTPLEEGLRKYLQGQEIDGS